MKFLNLGIVLLMISAGGNAYAAPAFERDRNIDFNNVDKNAVTWHYTLNGEKPEFLPELYREGNVNYLPVQIVRNLGATLELDAASRTAYISNNTDTFIIKEGSKEIYPSNKAFLIHQVPIWRNDTLYVSTNFLLTAGAVISENKFTNQLNVFKSYNILNELVTNFDTSENKVIFNMNTAPVFETEKNGNTYKVTLYGTVIKEKEKLQRQADELKSHFEAVTIDDSMPGITVFNFRTKTRPNIVNTFYLDKPSRLVVQFPKLFRDESRNLTRQGLYHSQVSSGDHLGPLFVNLLEINTNAGLDVSPVVARDNNHNLTLKELSVLIRESRAIAGVNAGYFSSATRHPLGLLIVNGETITPSIYNRSAFIEYNDGSFAVQNVEVTAFLNTYNVEGILKKVKMNSFNQVPMLNQIVLFTPVYGNTTLTKVIEVKADNNLIKKTSTVIAQENPVTPPTPQVEYIVTDNGRNIYRAEGLNNPIPDNGYVIYASGSAVKTLETALQNSTRMDLAFEFNQQLENVNYAVGAGPTLIKNKSVATSEVVERFQKDITEGRAPRTAVGIFGDRRLMLVTIDGRHANSRGVTLNELAYYLKQFGVKEAINFDGGGSTAMVLNGNVINIPSDGKERKVSNGLMIFSE